MAYAIIEAGGKQLRVEPGYFYDINRLAVEEDDFVTLDRVLLVANGGEVMVGQPLVEAASVEATVLRHLRGPKLIVYKMRPKKKTRKKRGHRQELTRLMIQSITVNGQVIASMDDAPVPASAATDEGSASEAATAVEMVPADVEEPTTTDAEAVTEEPAAAAPVTEAPAAEEPVAEAEDESVEVAEAVAEAEEPEAEAPAETAEEPVAETDTASTDIDVSPDASTSPADAAADEEE